MSTDRELLPLQRLSILVQLLSLVVGVAAIAVLARSFGPAVYGVLGVALSVAASLGNIQRLGLQAAMSKVLASQQSAANHARAIAAMVSALRLALLLLSFCLAWAILPQLMQWWPGLAAAEAYLPYVLVIMLLREWQAHSETILLSCQHERTALSLNAVLQISNLLLILPLAYFYGVFAYLQAQLVVFAISAAVMTVLAIKALPASSAARPAYRQLWQQLWPIAKVSYGTKLIYALWWQAPVLLASFYYPAEALGFLYMACQIADKVRAAGGALSRISLPRLSRLASSSESAFYQAFAENYRFWLLLSSLVMVVAAALVEPLLPVVLGQEFAPAAKVLLPMLVAAHGFMMLNWLGSGLLFPAGELGGLVKWQLLAKLLSFALLWVLAGAALPVFVLSCILAEYLPLAFYWRRGFGLMDTARPSPLVLLLPLVAAVLVLMLAFLE